MFNLFKRVKTIFGAEFNSALDKAEDPVKMLDQYMREMGEDIREAEEAVAAQIANEKMMKKKLDDAQAMVDKRHEQAEKGLEIEDEEFARRALTDKQTHQTRVDSLTPAWEQAAKDVKDIRSRLDKMKQEYQEMKMKKETLQARAQSAQVRKKMNLTMSDMDSEGSKAGFSRMEEKVMQYEAEAETSDERTSEARSLDEDFEAMSGQSSVDDELEAMKKKKQGNDDEFSKDEDFNS